VTTLTRVDVAMPRLDNALHARSAARVLRESGAIDLRERVAAAHLVKHRPGRRALVAYVIEESETGGTRILVGKSRAKGLDRRTVEVINLLTSAGFSAGSNDGVTVPPVSGVIPQWRMWLSPKIPGVTVTELIGGGAGREAAQRSADAARKLHATELASLRVHTTSDEVELLTGYLTHAAGARPEHAGRIENLLGACRRLAAGIPAGRTGTIHRDFYGDQVIVAGDGVSIVDLDLVSCGDPMLDVGNFFAHVAEQGLRERGDCHSFDHVCRTFAERYGLSETQKSAVVVYHLLTLARHVWISIRIPRRNHLTASILAECEAGVMHIG